jgi:hypothetical protein
MLSGYISSLQTPIEDRGTTYTADAITPTSTAPSVSSRAITDGIVLTTSTSEGEMGGRVVI